MPNSRSPIWTRTTKRCQNLTKPFTKPNSHSPIWTRITKPCQNLTKHFTKAQPRRLKSPPNSQKFPPISTSSIFGSCTFIKRVPIPPAFCAHFHSPIWTRMTKPCDNSTKHFYKTTATETQIFSLLSNKRTHRIHLPSASLQFLGSCTLIKRVPITRAFCTKFTYANNMDTNDQTKPQFNEPSIVQKPQHIMRASETHLLDEVEDVVQTHIGHVEHVLFRRHSSQDTSPPSLLRRRPGGAGSIDQAPSSSCGPKANQSSSSCVSDGHGGHYLQQVREANRPDKQSDRQTAAAEEEPNEGGEGQDDGLGI